MFKIENKIENETKNTSIENKTMENLNKFFISALLVCNIGTTDMNAASKNKSSLSNEYQQEWNSMTKKELSNALLVYKMAQNDNLSLTAAAVSWEESQFGKVQINFNPSSQTVDCGLFGNNSKTVTSKLDKIHNKQNMKKVCNDLISNPKYAYKFFVEEIKTWETYHKGKKNLKNFNKKVLSSYNGGYKGNSSYAERIAMRIKLLQKNLLPLIKKNV